MTRHVHRTRCPSRRAMVSRTNRSLHGLAFRTGDVRPLGVARSVSTGGWGGELSQSEDSSGCVTRLWGSRDGAIRRTGWEPGRSGSAVIFKDHLVEMLGRNRARDMPRRVSLVRVRLDAFGARGGEQGAP